MDIEIIIFLYGLVLLQPLSSRGVVESNKHPLCLSLDEAQNNQQIFQVEIPSERYFRFEISFCKQDGNLNGRRQSMPSQKAYLSTCSDHLKHPNWLQLTCPRRETNAEEYLNFEALAKSNKEAYHCLKVVLVPLHDTTNQFRPSVPFCLISSASAFNSTSLRNSELSDLSPPLNLLYSFVINANIKKADGIGDLVHSFSTHHDEKSVKSLKAPKHSCDSTDIVTTAAVYIDTDFDELNVAVRLTLLKKFSAFMGLSLTSLSIKTTLDPFDLHSKENYLNSGAGNKKEKSSSKMTVLEWVVGCGKVQSHQHPPLMLLERTASNGILGNNIGSGILGWRVRNMEMSPSEFQSIPQTFFPTRVNEHGIYDTPQNTAGSYSTLESQSEVESVVLTSITSEVSPTRVNKLFVTSNSGSEDRISHEFNVSGAVDGSTLESKQFNFLRSQTYDTSSNHNFESSQPKSKSTKLCTPEQPTDLCLLVEPISSTTDQIYGITTNAASVDHNITGTNRDPATNFREHDGLSNIDEESIFFTHQPPTFEVFGPEDEFVEEDVGPFQFDNDDDDGVGTTSNARWYDGDENFEYEEEPHEEKRGSDNDLHHQGPNQHDTKRHEGKKFHNRKQNHDIKPSKTMEPLHITVGSVLEYRIPSEVFIKDDRNAQNVDLLFLTFTELGTPGTNRKVRSSTKTNKGSDGRVKNKPFKDHLSETIGVPPNSWIKHDRTTQSLQGLPLEEHIGKHRYVLATVNKNTILSRVELEIRVQQKPSTQVLSHEFEITVKNLEYKRAAQDVSTRIALVKKVALAFGDLSPRNIIVTGMAPGSVKLAWSNISLPVTPCPYSQLQHLMGCILQSSPNSWQVSDNFQRALKPYSISFARFISRGSCADAFSSSKQLMEPSLGSDRNGHQGDDLPTSTHLTDEVQRNPLLSNDDSVTTLLYIMIPMVAIAAFLLIVLLTCVCCYIFGGINRPSFGRSDEIDEKESPEQYEKRPKKNSSANCVPIIFANELKNPGPLYPARPVLADQVCPRTPPPTYTHSVNMTESSFHSSLRSQRHRPIALDCSFSGNSNSLFSGSRNGSADDSNNESAISLRDVKSKKNDSFFSVRQTGPKDDTYMRSDASNDYS